MRRVKQSITDFLHQQENMLVVSGVLLGVGYVSMFDFMMRVGPGDPGYHSGFLAIVSLGMLASVVAWTTGIDNEDEEEDDQ